MSAAMKARLVGGYGRSEDAGRSPTRGLGDRGCGRRWRKARPVPAATTEPSVRKRYVRRGRSEDAGRSPARGARYCAADLASRT